MDLAFLPLELRWSDVTSSQSIGGNDTRKNQLQTQKGMTGKTKEHPTGSYRVMGSQKSQEGGRKCTPHSPSHACPQLPIDCWVIWRYWMNIHLERAALHTPALQPRQIKCANAYQKSNSIITLYFKIMLPFPLDIIIFYGSLTSYTNNKYQTQNHLDSMELTCPVSTSVPSGNIKYLCNPLSSFYLVVCYFLFAESMSTLDTQGHPFQISRLSPHSASSETLSPPLCLTEMWPSQDFSQRDTAHSHSGYLRVQAQACFFLLRAASRIQWILQLQIKLCFLKIHGKQWCLLVLTLILVI